jgi:hypothetical protein
LPIEVVAPADKAEELPDHLVGEPAGLRRCHRFHRRREAPRSEAGLECREPRDQIDRGLGAEPPSAYLGDQLRDRLWKGGLGAANISEIKTPYCGATLAKRWFAWVKTDLIQTNRSPRGSKMSNLPKWRSSECFGQMTESSLSPTLAQGASFNLMGGLWTFAASRTNVQLQHGKIRALHPRSRFGSSRPVPNWPRPREANVGQLSFRLSGITQDGRSRLHPGEK